MITYNSVVNVVTVVLVVLCVYTLYSMSTTELNSVNKLPEYNGGMFGMYEDKVDIHNEPERTDDPHHEVNNANGQYESQPYSNQLSDIYRINEYTGSHTFYGYGEPGSPVKVEESSDIIFGENKSCN